MPNLSVNLQIEQDAEPRVRMAHHIATGATGEKKFSLDLAGGEVLVTFEDEPTYRIGLGGIVEAIAAERESAWTPLRRTDEAVHRLTGASVVPDNTEDDEIWTNDLYVVHVRRQPELVHLSLHRFDRAPVRDWRHIQRIKNEIVGPDCEGVEIYPAEDRLVDTANQYHVFVFSDPGFRIPFGFDERLVCSPEEAAEHGAVQRRLEN